MLNSAKCRALLAFLLGVAATFTLPPFFAFPFLFVSYAGLYWLLAQAPTARRAFWDGWWWGWGHHITGLYWFCIALLTEPEKFAWLIPFTLLGLMGVIAIYPAVACWLFFRLRMRGLVGLFIFAAVWAGIEFARGHLFSGFPWNLPAYSLMFSDSVLQLASIFGAYGLSFWAVLLGTAPAAFFISGITRRAAIIYCGVLAALFAVGFGWGYSVLQAADSIPEKDRTVPGVHLRLVQANIAQHHKWDPSLQMQGLQEHIRLMRQQGLEKVTHVIWPETAIPYIIRPDSGLTRMLGKALPKNVILISGGLRDEGTRDTWKIWNSLQVINHEGKILGGYDKSKLVPFGEFLPFRSLIPKGWATPVGDTDYSSGPGYETLKWPGLPSVSPLICYEVIFPDRAVGENRPAWLLSVTNDAWFGYSTGPYQHFHMARMRAVEQGLPLVRVGNTGISGQIDAYGRVTASLGLGQSGILDIELQKPQLYATYYSEHKNIFMLLLLAISLLLFIRQRIHYTN